jgi:hypothetical protein
VGRKAKRVIKSNTRLTFKSCKDLAVSKGGKCLSTEYVNNRTKMKWQCNDSHTWETSRSSISMGTWCPKCAIKKNSDNQRSSLNDCQDLAASKGGKCLSTEYENSKTKMKWQCSENHKWENTYSGINSGHWCPKCAIRKNAENQRHTIQHCHDAAALKGGKCLSTEYVDAQTKMKWQCSEKHEWNAVMCKITYGTWCPKCSYKITADKQRHTIQHCHDLAAVKGGKCLSTEYINNNTKMLWQCSYGHEWETIKSVIKMGHWCPKCVGNKSEEMCRDIIERNIMEKFPNTRPKFMKGLELDGYNADLNIAFEYNGIQHYEYNSFFHRDDPENLVRQKERDRKKYKLCREHNIDLIIIPYQYSYKNPEELEEFIMAELWKIS